MKNLAISKKIAYNEKAFNRIGPNLMLDAVSNPDCAFILGEDVRSPFDSEKVNTELIETAKKIKESPKIEICSYELNQDLTEEEIIESSKFQGIYLEVDICHIDAICRKHFIEKNKLLSTKILANIFFVRDSKGNLSTLKIVSLDSITYSLMLLFSPERIRHKGQRFFLLGKM